MNHIHIALGARAVRSKDSQEMEFMAARRKFVLSARILQMRR
jgi:hypothetical protein